MKVVVTGATGLLGWHTSVRLHARNIQARHGGAPAPFDIVRLDHAAFGDRIRLEQAVCDCDAVFHFAGVNRGTDADIEHGNRSIAQDLVDACKRLRSAPHIIYANSTHAHGETPYGRSKRAAGEILRSAGGPVTNLVIPHVFGEGARPNYNNVTATFIDAVVQGKAPHVDPNGRVELVHAGAVAETAIDAAVQRTEGDVVVQGRATAVPDLLDKIQRFHDSYETNIFPDFHDSFDVALFNSYRATLYPAEFPRRLRLNSDARGTLFEAVKGGGGGQSFLSWTEPGATRGEHFHLTKVERFLVLQGQAVIRIRRVLGDQVWEYPVSGATPTPVDMPTMHAHSIKNVGKEPLLTLFWTHELLDPAAPDTYAEPVEA